MADGVGDGHGEPVPLGGVVERIAADLVGRFEHAAKGELERLVGHDRQELPLHLGRQRQVPAPADPLEQIGVPAGGHDDITERHRHLEQRLEDLGRRLGGHGHLEHPKPFRPNRHRKQRHPLTLPPLDGRHLTLVGAAGDGLFHRQRFGGLGAEVVRYFLQRRLPVVGQQTLTAVLPTASDSAERRTGRRANGGASSSDRWRSPMSAWSTIGCVLPLMARRQPDRTAAQRMRTTRRTSVDGASSSGAPASTTTTSPAAANPWLTTASTEHHTISSVDRY